MHIDLFLFDIAGTTVRDDGWVIAAFTEAASAYGLDPGTEWLRARMGLHKLLVFRQLLAREGAQTIDPADLVRRFDDSIERLIAITGVQPLPGAAACIDQLRRGGVRVGFTTGFGATTARRVIDGAGFEADVIVGSDEVAQGRPAPDLIFEGMRRLGVRRADRVAVAGDTPSDLHAGTAAGCRFVIGVGHGSHTLAELASSPHTHLLPDLNDVSELVLQVAGAS